MTSTTSVLGRLEKDAKVFPRKGDVVIGQRQKYRNKKHSSAAVFAGASALLKTQIANHGDTFDASSDAITRDVLVRRVEEILHEQGVRFLAYDTVTSEFMYVENMDEVRREIFFAFIDRKKTHTHPSMTDGPSTVRSGASKVRNLITAGSPPGTPNAAKRRRVSEESSSSKKAITDDDSVAANFVDLTDEPEKGIAVDSTTVAYKAIVNRAAAQQEQLLAAAGSSPSTMLELSAQQAQLGALQQQQRIAAINSMSRQQQGMTRLQQESSLQKAKALRRFEGGVQQLSGQATAQTTATPNAFSVAAGNILKQRHEQERRSIKLAALRHATSPAVSKMYRGAEAVAARMLPHHHHLLAATTAPAATVLPSSHAITYAEYFYKPLRMKELPIKTTQDMVGWQFLPMNMENNLKDLPHLNEWRIVVTPMTGNPERSFTIDPSTGLPTGRE